MKKIINLILSLILIVGLGSCRHELPDDPTSGNGDVPGENDSVTEGTYAVSTAAAQNVSSTSAVLGGSLVASDLTVIAEVGIEYLPTAGEEADSIFFVINKKEILTQTATLGQSWSLGIGGLETETEYAYRAYAKSKADEMLYGDIRTFKTTLTGSGNGESYTGEMAGDTNQAGEYDSSDDDYYENSTFSTIITVHYAGDVATVNDPTGNAVVTQDGAYVTINCETNGMSKVEIIATGTTDNGHLKIYGSSKYKLTLNGVSITSQRGAALNNQCKKRTFIHLGENSVNRLTDAKTWTNEVASEDCKGTLFSEAKTIISGAGVLCVSGNAKHGIAVDDYLRVRKGVTLVITNATKDGIHTNDGVVIEGGLVNVTATSDGIEAEENGVIVNGGKVIVSSDDDAIVSSFEGDNATTPSDIVINQGDLYLTTTGEKAHGLKSDQGIIINGGLVQATVKGNASKGMASDGDMTITGGTMVLTTTGGGIYENSDTKAAAGIKCDGNLVINNATISCTSSGAGGKGINVDGTLTINSGNITIYTSGGRYTYSRLTSSPKGIKSQGDLTINGGNIKVNVTGVSEGSEGIESKSTITINDGVVEVYAYDDGINASKAIVINGGKIYCYAENNDGIDSNGTITVNGGLVISSGTRSPEEGFDCDNNTFKITGGILIGMGGATSTPTASVCTQYSIIQSVNATQNSIMNLSSSDGTSIITFKFPRTLSSACMLLSAPGISNGSYVIKTGGSCDGSEWNGYYSNGTYSGGSQVATITVSSVVTGGSSGGGPGGGGNRPW